jgi:hypothetical protein
MDVHVCIRLLEQALLTGEQELEALNEGQIEEAGALEEERSRLTQEAMKLADDAPLDILLVKLQKLCDMQKRLTGVINELRQDWQKEFARVRGENRRLAGYKQAMAHALH